MIKDYNINGRVRIEYRNTKEMRSDGLTKPIPSQGHDFHTDNMKRRRNNNTTK